MRRFQDLLLAVWREACKHTEIADAFERIAPLLSRLAPLDYLLIRIVDFAGNAVETVAASSVDGATVPFPPRQQSTPEQIGRLAEWLRQGGFFRGPVNRFSQTNPPELLPAGLEREVLLGPLVAEGDHLGAVVLVARQGMEFGEQEEAVLQVLLEPFAVALENDRRLHELVTLREKVEADNRTLLARLGKPEVGEVVIGADSGLSQVMERVGLVAKADLPALILGETGSGKEVVARAIHHQSRRANGPFQRVNCGAIAPELVDSELFGHEKGSFTGAGALRKGWFERADGGTLFLDECGELTPAAQVRLLRILQDGSFQRVGGERQLHVDVRVVAATHRDLRAMCAAGSFREDLWYRLAVFPIVLPALRERVGDIPAMAAHFSKRAARKFGLALCLPSESELALLQTYSWPGNVRELASVIDRAAILGDGKKLEVAAALGVAAHRPAAGEFAQPEAPSPSAAEPALLPLTLNRAMAEHIEKALEVTRGRVEGPEGAARLLGINPHTLRARMRKLGVEVARFRKTDAGR